MIFSIHISTGNTELVRLITVMYQTLLNREVKWSTSIDVIYGFPCQVVLGGFCACFGLTLSVIVS